MRIKELDVPAIAEPDDEEMFSSSGVDGGSAVGSGTTLVDDVVRATDAAPPSKFVLRRGKTWRRL